MAQAGQGLALSETSGEWVVLKGARRSDRHAQFVADAFFFEIWTFLIGLIVGESARAAATRHPVAVDLRAGKLRFGRRMLAFTDIDAAYLDVVQRPREIELRFGARSGLQVVVPLVKGDRITMGKHTRETLLEMLPATAIRIPEDPYDPKGRFARSTFPTNITGDEAIELVRNPPRPGDPLPVSLPPGF